MPITENDREILFILAKIKELPLLPKALEKLIDIVHNQFEEEWEDYQDRLEQVWPEVDQLWNLLS